MIPPTAHHALRQATAEAHERLDMLFGRFDLADRSGYAQFLHAHAAAALAVEAALDAAGMAAQLADWPQRRRAGCLRQDLHALGLSTPPPLSFTALATPAGCWGAAYVLEGSRLGGAVLARRLPAEAPRAYLAAAVAPAAWPQLLRQLDAALPTAALHAEAAAAALRVFALFELAAHHTLTAEAA